ncbi:MAG: HD domain-containing protein [Sulfuricurvum sp.]|uniref:HD domain-containing phosphohydrolase n=1 Tax=Sulfuricurvum sp. TaxID=2025608 RepID=UPI0025EA84F1|nr:HD domain-containing phosphohydrolase [Sulfuricurvum sp.]MBV5322042.1 HD domain-containing protein [Sulfuricurvum sp.]
MEYIEFLGISGTKSTSHGTTCLRVSKHSVIDAGNLIQGMGIHIYDIEHIFITHSHLDHIIDIPFVADLFVIRQTKPLKIYGLKNTLDDLRQFIFNHRIWPDFEQINLLNHNDKTIQFIEISPDEPYQIDGVTLTPFKTNHTDGSCGYMIEHNANGVLFTSDTYKCNKIWEIIDENPHIHSLIVDVSFPSRYQQLANDSKHLTPQILSEELLKCTRQDFRIFPIHMKPLLENSIIEELTSLGILERGGHVLESFECLPYDPSEKKPNFFQQGGHSVISQIIAIGAALSSEKNIDTLLEMIISQTKLLTHADGGTLYLYNSQKKQLEFKVIQNDSMGIKMGGTSGEIEWSPLNLYDAEGNKNNHMVAVVCALDQIIVNIPDVHKSTSYDFSGTIAFDKNTGYRSESMLVLPLKDHEDNLIAVLQLINKKEGDGSIIAFDHNDEEIVVSLGSQAAVALTKQKLINDLELLLESFLNTINVAIEEKSPYTAGHIDKMVDLSMSLARAISEDKEYFPLVSYNEDQIKELKFSALMHDIGKITIPEYVIDKSTKLETIYDRIENVKLKYEILKRDAHIEYISKKCSTDNASELNRVELDYQALLNTLDSELAFLCEINEGAEFISNEKIDKVRQIGERTIILNDIEQSLLNADEIENLCVQKGTLTEKQRHIINNHAAVSHRMLNQLPFPRKLARIAEIASGHHEKINGKGYPLGLKGDELSFEARILAIADIFEALSASDRPYKKAKKLSEVMKILYFMAKDGDIDTDIVRFFYESGLYLRYAKESLKVENIDEVTLDFTNL